MLLGYAMLPWLTDIASNLAWSVEPCRSFHGIGRLTVIRLLARGPIATCRSSRPARPTALSIHSSTRSAGRRRRDLGRSGRGRTCASGGRWRFSAAVTATTTAAALGDLVDDDVVRAQAGADR